MMPQFLKVSRVWLSSHGIVVDHADAETVRLAVEHAGIEQRIDIARLDRPVADPALVGRDFDQRLQPIHAARAGADDLDIEPALLEGFAEAHARLPRRRRRARRNRGR